MSRVSGGAVLAATPDLRTSLSMSFFMSQEEIVAGTQQFTGTRISSKMVCIVEVDGALCPGEVLTQSAVTTPAGPRRRYTSLWWLIRTAFSDTRRKTQRKNLAQLRKTVLRCATAVRRPQPCQR